MAIELKVPSVGESITEVEIGEWLKRKGESLRKDEPVVALESEKATVELPAPESGTLTEILKQKGETAKVGEVIGYLEKDGEAQKSAKPPVSEAAKAPEQAKAEPGPAAKVSAQEETKVMPAEPPPSASHVPQAPVGQPASL